MNKDLLAIGAVAIAAVALVQPSVFTDARAQVVTAAEASGLVERTPIVTPDPIAPEAPDTTARQRTQQAQPQAPSVPPPGAYGSTSGANHYNLTDAGGGATASWSSCAPIPVVINPANAPKGAVNDMKVALQRMKLATGLDIRYLGATDAATKNAWGHHSQAGFDGWPPVLISWANPGDAGAAGLEGISAFAEPSWRANAQGQNVMVSGRILFNISEDQAYTPGFGSEGSRVALQMHEFGHILGLDHVEDDEQLMNATIYARDLGAGDLSGLDQVSGNCLDAPGAP